MAKILKTAHPMMIVADKDPIIRLRNHFKHLVITVS